MIFLNDLTFLLPELFIFFSLSVLLLGNVFNNEFKFKFVNKPGISSYNCIHIENIKTIFLTVFLVSLIASVQPFANFILFECQLSINIFNYFVKLLLFVFSFLFFFINVNYIKWVISTQNFEFYFLIMSSILGMLFMIMSNDFVIFYLSIELQSVIFYIMAASKKYSEVSVEAGLKYFVMGSLTSGFLIFGVSIIYGCTGTINFLDLITLFFNDEITSNMADLEVGILFLISGLLFKFSAAPFHNWVPDVYDGASVVITMFFSIIPKLPVFYFIIVVLNIVLFNYMSIWTFLLTTSAWLSIMLGSFGALYQSHVKRFIAYTTISHVGFILLPLSLGTVDGVFSSIVYIIIYIMLTLAFFLVLVNVRSMFNVNLTTINDFLALYKSYPIVAIGVMFLLFSTAGIPPLAGFFSKFFILNSLISAEAYFSSIICVLFSVISSVYYIRIIKNMFFLKKTYWKEVIEFPYNVAFVFSIFFFFNLFAFPFLSYIIPFALNFTLIVLFF